MLRNLFSRFVRDERGVTLVEYGIGVTLAIVVGTFLLTTLGTSVNANLAGAASVMDDACTTTATTADAVTVGNVTC